ncbi:MAG TPA: YifB family Mg chelatase-like AAA ATPase, partial [Nitriliruptorales bacterium]
MLASVGAIALFGMEPRPVRVECSVGSGLPGVRVVGSPDTAVREAADRAKSAVQRSGFTWPDTRVIVNLAPAALKKTGAGFDLAVALGTMAASEQLKPRMLGGLWAFGELGLDGTARAVPGTLAVARAVRDLGGRLLLPAAAAREAALVEGLELLPVRDLREAVEIVTGQARPQSVEAPEVQLEPWPTDLIEIRGQAVGRRALEIAAAGSHHLLLVGPPGCGKSMLAERLPSILEPLDIETALEVAAVHSVAGARDPQAPLALRPPLRAPHHSTSLAGLVGGGVGLARPGEASLAHRGVLFLDELLEFPRNVLDGLRQPLERGEVRIVRSAGAVRYPCDVQLVAATNPCPCGHLGSPARACRCRPDQIERYRARLSGPLL